MKSKKMLFQNGYKIIPVVECLVTHGNKVLLVKRSEHTKKFPGYWCGPGGHVDEDEDYLTTAIRETEEETGVKIPKNRIKLKVVAIGNHIDKKETYLVLHFLVHLDKFQESKSSREGEAVWVDKAKLKKMKKLFPAFRFYLNHTLTNRPGIMYSNVLMKDARVIKVLSNTFDKDG